MWFRDHSLKLVYSDLEVFLVKEKQKQFLNPEKNRFKLSLVVYV